MKSSDSRWVGVASSAGSTTGATASTRLGLRCSHTSVGVAVPAPEHLATRSPRWNQENQPTDTAAAAPRL